jgi:serine/threonine-protein kinase
LTNPEDPPVRPAVPAALSTAEREALASGEATDLAAVTHIGVYRVLGALGSGGMGTVVLAFDDRLQRQVAIKRIHAGRQINPLARERLRREAAAAATLNHPAVVQVHDILEDESGDAIVMEYVEGRTLAQMLARGPLPVPQAIGIARQVAEGLAAAHGLGLIHRDLKTQNVMVTPSGQAKILDFGLAKRLEPGPDDESLTAEGAVVGTRRAMSPEQAKGGTLDVRSDLFSLGVLIYEICTGRSPFRGDDRGQTLERVIAEVPPSAADLSPGVSAPLATLVKELLEKDPARRPASAEKVAARLRRIESRQSARRWPLLAATLVLALAAIAGATLWWSRSPPRPDAVLVQEPRITPSPGDERSALAAFALREAALRALAGLEGIEPIGPSELPEGPLSVQDAARAVAADEIVIPTVACQGHWCRVSLRRERARDGRVVTSTGSFDVSSEPEDSLALASAVAIHVREAFPDHRPRSSSERVEVKSTDYARYLQLLKHAEAGEALVRPDIDELEQLTRSSPGLTDAYILSAQAARLLGDRPRSDAIVRAAHAHGLTDPRLADERFLLELETGQMADAESAFAELERRAPGDIRVWRARGRLLARQGKLQEAAEVHRRLVRERPSWKNLWYVASVEMDLGDAKGARQHLEQLLQVSPGNPKGLAMMAELEWLMGDPLRAAQIYEGLLKERVTERRLSNLGWSRLLAGDYTASAAAYRQALDLAPDDLLNRLNLGIALEGAGDKEGAHRLYRELLDRMAPREKSGALVVSERLIKAQALARLGEAASAVALTIQALGEGDKEPQVIFQAALIYALCGEQNHAILNAREARRRGLSSKWFGIPGFESLRNTPAFRELLDPA